MANVPLPHPMSEAEAILRAELESWPLDTSMYDEAFTRIGEHLAVSRQVLAQLPASELDLPLLSALLAYVQRCRPRGEREGVSA